MKTTLIIRIMLKIKLYWLCRLTFYDCRLLAAIHKIKRAFERDISVKSSEYFSRVEASNPLHCRDLNSPVQFWTLKCISVTLSGSADRFVAGGLRARSGYDATRTTFHSACGIRRRRSLHCVPLVGRRSRRANREIDINALTSWRSRQDAFAKYTILKSRMKKGEWPLLYRVECQVKTKYRNMLVNILHEYEMSLILSGNGITVY